MAEKGKKGKKNTANTGRKVYVGVDKAQLGKSARERINVAITGALHEEVVGMAPAEIVRELEKIQETLAHLAQHILSLEPRMQPLSVRPKVDAGISC